MKKLWLSVAVLLLIGGCGDDLSIVGPVVPSPVPSATPAPVAKDACDILRTDIFATVKGSGATAWITGQIAVLDAVVSYRGNPPEDLDPATPPQTPFDPTRCESLDIVTWVLPGGPSAPHMELQGNLNRNNVRLKVYEPGYFIIKVVPQGITAPVGEAAFHVLPGEGDSAFAPLAAGESIRSNR